jgi:uncharacterized membrane protein
MAALAPPTLVKDGKPLAAMAVFAFFSKLCHQRPERSLLLFGAPTAVCARCLGIYAGAAFGGALRLSQRASLRCLGAALGLNILDVLAESIRLHGNLPQLRFGMGWLLGFAAAALLCSRNESEVLAAGRTLE